MRLAFRADASRQIGYGHVMRCLTIAGAMKRRGAESRFVSKQLPTPLRELVAREGHELVDVRSLDAQESLAALSGGAWDWILVDHYGLDARWETPMRAAAARSFAIDDLADRRHDVDVLLDQNLISGSAGTAYDDRIAPGCVRLFGPKYALVRKKFVDARKSLAPRSGVVSRVLVFFGGTDPQDYTSRALDAIIAARIGDLAVDVIIGAEHPNRAPLNAVCAARGFTLHVQTDRVAELMASADLAIGAGGSASWERCCLGLPAICVAIADNQRPVIRGLAESGAAVEIEGHRSGLVEKLERSLRELAKSPEQVASMSVKASALVDGLGVERVCDVLSDREPGVLSAVSLRPATGEDTMRLWEWRNDPLTRRMSISTRVVPLDEHREWLARRLGQPERGPLLVAESDGEPVGMARLDIIAGETELSWSVAPEHRGRGIGAAIVAACLRKFPGYRPFFARIKPENVASLRIARRLGILVRPASHGD